MFKRVLNLVLPHILDAVISVLSEKYILKERKK